MADARKSYPVVIRKLPLDHFKTEKDLQIYVNNSLKNYRLAEAAGSDESSSSTHSGTTKTRSYSEPPLSGDTNAEVRRRAGSDAPIEILPTNVVHRVYFPLPRNLLRHGKDPPWRSKEDNTDEVDELTSKISLMSVSQNFSKDSHCDAVVDFVTKEDQDAFAWQCETKSTDRFQVDPLSPVFDRVKASVEPGMCETLLENRKLTGEIEKKSGVLVQLVHGSSIAFIGKEWQVEIAKYHLSNMSNYAQFHTSPESTSQKATYAHKKHDQKFLNGKTMPKGTEDELNDRNGRKNEKEDKNRDKQETDQQLSPTKTTSKLNGKDECKKETTTEDGKARKSGAVVKESMEKTPQKRNLGAVVEENHESLEPGPPKQKRLSVECSDEDEAGKSRDVTDPQKAAADNTKSGREGSDVGESTNRSDTLQEEAQMDEVDGSRGSEAVRLENERRKVDNIENGYFVTDKKKLAFDKQHANEEYRGKPDKGDEHSSDKSHRKNTKFTAKNTETNENPDFEDFPFSTELHVHLGYWFYIKTHEHNFTKKLQNTLAETGAKISEVPEKNALKIQGKRQQDVDKLKKLIEDPYQGFEFNLHEKNLSDVRSIEDTDEELLMERFPKVVFHQKEGQMNVIGNQEDVDLCLENLRSGKIGEAVGEMTKERRFEKSDNTARQRIEENEEIVEQTRVRNEKLTQKELASMEKQFVSSREVLAPIYHYMNTFFTKEVEALKLRCSLETKISSVQDRELVKVDITAGDQNSMKACMDAFVSICKLILYEEVSVENEDQAESMVHALKKGLKSTAIYQHSNVLVCCLKEDTDQLFKIVSSQREIKTRTRKLKNTSASEIDPENMKPMPTNEQFCRAGFLLYENTTVLVHKCDITKLAVDAIVNAANNTLDHGGGVAKVIADRAGPELDRESRRIMSQKRLLRDADVEVTTAGMLPCKKVLHAVGPQWYRYRDYEKNKCIKALEDTFCNILTKAVVENVRSIAIPPVSSGIYKVPHQHVVQTMCKAIIEGTYSAQTVKMIHLVDINDGLLDMIVGEFLKYQQNKRSVGDIVVLDAVKVDKLVSKDLFCLPKGYLLHDKVQVFVHRCDITQMKVEIIASPAGSKYSYHKGGVEKAIAYAADPLLKTECESWYKAQKVSTDGSIFTTSAQGRLLCDAVFHAVAPVWPTSSWSTSSTPSKQSVAKEILGMMYHNLWVKAKQSGCQSIAVPPIGSGRFYFPNEVVVKVIQQTMTHSLKDAGTLREVHIVDIKDDILTLIARNLSDSKSTKQLDQDPVIFHIRERAPTTTYKSENHARNITPMDTSEGSSVDNVRATTSQPRDGTRPKTYAIAAAPTPSYLVNTNKHNHTRTNEEETPSKPPIYSSDYRRRNQESSTVSKTVKTTNSSDKTRKQNNDQQETDNDCVICRNTITKPKVLNKCKHKFCTDCIDQCFKQCGPKCPTCGEMYGKITGTQPRGGTMNHSRNSSMKLPGYASYGTITIRYQILGGTQGSEHPHPGKRFSGITRTAYLPDNVEGNEILELLKKAFDARLIFTVGTSTTTGLGDQVTWNDIHHKTSSLGGPPNFGYPDSTYLRRVRDELAAKGIK